MRRNALPLVMFALASLCLTACIGELPNDDVEILDVLVVRYDYRGTSFEAAEGEPIGLSLSFDLLDQDRYGLPPTADFVPGGSSDFPRVDLDLNDYPRELAATDPTVACFEPIDVMDAADQTLMTIEGFCGDDDPLLWIFGDFATGEGIGWSYETQEGTVTVLVDETPADTLAGE